MPRVATELLQTLAPAVILFLLWIILSLRSRKEIARVVVGEDLLTATRRSGRVVRMPWSDLREVRVVTKDPDPMDEDVVWILRGDTAGELRIPIYAGRAGDLLERLQRLPGFDSRAVSKAMASTRAGTHRCWRRPEA